MAVARRFAVGGYRVTLVARRPDGLGDLAGSLADSGAKISTIAADASDPDRLGARMRELYLGNSPPGGIVYNAVMGTKNQLLSSSVAHVQAAYSVDVISAIVVAQVAAPAMPAASWDHPRHRGRPPTTRSRPLRPFPSARRLSGRPRQCSALTWNRTASGWPRRRSQGRSCRYFL